MVQPGPISLAAWSSMHGQRSIDTILATGNGGQKIFIIPSLELVAVFTGSNYNSPRRHTAKGNHGQCYSPSVFGRTILKIPPDVSPFGLSAFPRLPALN